MNSDALNYALNYLRIPHTRYELVNKLKQKKFNTNDVEDVVNYLTDRGYLDDEKYVKVYIDYYLFVKGESKKAVVYKLLNKGIDKNIIDGVFDDIQDYDEVEAISKIVKQKFKNVDFTDKTVVLKVKKYLYAKGFSFEAINKAIKKLI
ncbi:MAG: regulatory protein RecX [Thermoanaerobacteraceae bacterium]|nr:regulatory protein RecX [Thermoanaerobacteraceae bacterium]